LEGNVEAYEKLGSRVDDIRNRLYEAAGSHWLAATFWNRVQFGLGLPATLVAAFAGVSVVAEQEFLAGIAALLSAALSGLVTFSRPIDRFRGHDGAFRAYLGLADQMNNFFLRVGPPASPTQLEELWSRFEEFQGKEANLNSGSPYLPSRFVNKLRRQSRDHTRVPDRTEQR
jgi:hypothetical protein